MTVPNMESKLDETDIRILQSLQKDGRMALNDLAKSINISVPTVRARIRRLTELGIVKQFTVVIDPQKLIGSVMAFVSLEVKLPQLEAVGRALAELEEVTEVYLTTGESDILIKICVPDMRSLEEFIIHKLSKIQGIEHSYNNIIVETVKEQYGPIIRPGFGIKLSCRYCKKEIKETPVKRIIGDKEHYFCCTTCATVYEKTVKRT
jgi:DNA-binding Lrp family transcriptional regulator